MLELDPGREQALNNIGFVWNTVTAMWEERYRRLTEWKRVHGHCAVPIAQGELGTWVSKQRQLRKRGKLSQEKIDALNNLGFTWSTAEADWEDKFKRLCQWAKERGHASVPFNEGELGWWVNTQRQCKRKGKLSLAREERLCSLGFVWNPSNSRNKNNDLRAQQQIRQHQQLHLQQRSERPQTQPQLHQDHHVESQPLQLRQPHNLLPTQSQLQQQQQHHQYHDRRITSTGAPPPPPRSVSSADTTPRTTPEKYEQGNLLPRPSDTIGLLPVDSKQTHTRETIAGSSHAQFQSQAAAANAAVHAQALSSFGPHSTNLSFDLGGTSYGPFVGSDLGVGVGVPETPPQPLVEGPFSSVPAGFNSALWSPIDLASPSGTTATSGLLNSHLAYGSGGSSTPAALPLQLQPSMQQHGVVSFSQAMQTHSDALEQLLSRTAEPNTEHDACS